MSCSLFLIKTVGIVDSRLGGQSGSFQHVGGDHPSAHAFLVSRLHFSDRVPDRSAAGVFARNDFWKNEF